MIIYVFLVWLFATLFFLGLEGFVLFQTPHPVEYLQEFFQARPELLSQTGVSVHHLPWIPTLLYTGSLSVTGLICAYFLEKKLKLLHKSYGYLQKTYPLWYRFWPAAWRELILVLLLWGGISLLLWGAFLKIGLSRYVLQLEFFWLFFCLGLALQPLKRYQILQREDRPEKAVRAVLHRLKPEFPMKYSLILGQLYLRLLLPFFCLFILLVPALELGYLRLQALQYGAILSGLFTGLVLAWLLLRESSFEPSCWNENFSAISLRLLLAGGFLLIGAFSENYILLLAFSHFAGLIAGSY